MGRIKGSGKPWEYHFAKRLSFTGECVVWLGRVNRKGVPMFTAIGVRKNKPLSKTAVWFMYWYKNGSKKPSNITWHPVKTCGVDRCINPDHYTDYSPEKLRPNKNRDAEIKRLYSGYLEYRRWSMGGIGRKYGISRQRVEQILKEKEDE